jgi:8-amino-7-oxononanoate synthase
LRDFFYFRDMKYSSKDLIDFASNDYLGFSKNKNVSDEIIGNEPIFEEVEDLIAVFHQTESASIFNSFQEANFCFFSLIPKKGDLILFDELCPSSIRDAILLSKAKSHPFEHNDFQDLEKLIQNQGSKTQNQGSKTQNSEAIYILTESVFSMDGDTPNLEELAQLSQKYHCNLVIDESNSVGVFGSKGEGLVQMLGLQDSCFARIVTFENALGFAGATIIGSNKMKANLLQLSQSSNYSSEHPALSLAFILEAYHRLESDIQSIEILRENRIHFNQELNLLGLKPLFVRSKSAIQSAIISGNQNVKRIADQFQEKGFIVNPILSPEVPEGQERLRFCLHSFNSREEISEVLRLLSTIIFS